jgi:ATP-dependent RNA helicase DDX3X
MLENIEACGYTLPTPIQSVCIPAILQGKQLLVCAQTGTGKTAAFLIPIFSRLMGKYKTLAAPRAGMSLPKDEFSRAEPLVLIIAPTRELALQTYDHCRRLSYRTMLRPVCVFGGGEMTGPNGQMTQLQYGCDILIATLGRLVDLLSDPLLISLRRVK